LPAQGLAGFAGFHRFSSVRHRLRLFSIAMSHEMSPASGMCSAMQYDHQRWTDHCDQRRAAGGESSWTVPTRRRQVKAMDPEAELLARITTNLEIFGGKPIIRGRRFAVEHLLGMLAAGDTAETILKGYDWLEPEDIRACLLYARRVVDHERVEPALSDR
jgi:uncharacterized protein (DUF433 family)